MHSSVPLLQYHSFRKLVSLSFCVSDWLLLSVIVTAGAADTSVSGSLTAVGSLFSAADASLTISSGLLSVLGSLFSAADASLTIFSSSLSALVVSWASATSWVPVGVMQ